MFSKSPTDLFPEIEPFHSCHLSSKDGHEIYVEQSGNPNGQPILFLHGGPGGGTGAKQRRFFDPKHYLIILFDQRGCGQSKPLGEIKDNTTAHLLHDIEAIRKHFKIDSWILFGGSWGSSLALEYAINYSDKVKGLILRGIFLSRESELNWFLRDVEHFFPELYKKLIDHRPGINKDNLIEKYSQLIFHGSQDEAEKAAFSWNQFEGSILKLFPDEGVGEVDSINYAFELARAKVQMHYIINNCFINGEEILDKANVLKSKPIVIVQGRYDMVCPPKTAYELTVKLPQAKLIMVPDAGHSASEKGTLSALIKATEDFKSL